MPKVEIYKLNDNGTQSIVAVCKLAGNRVICEGDNRVFVENLERNGIIDYSSKGKKTLFPKDGLKFLEQLQYNFKSGYLNASKVRES